MTLTMGCDPHLDSFTMAVVDHLDAVVTEQSFTNTATGWRQAAEVATDLAVSHVGIEGASGHGRALAWWLTRSGIPVTEIPTRVTVNTRRIDGASKTDPGDARAIARALHRNEGTRWIPDPALESLRVVSHHRETLVQRQTADINTLRALTAEVDPHRAAATPRIRSRRALQRFLDVAYHQDTHQHTVTDTIKQLAATCLHRHDQITELATRLHQLLPPVGHRLIADLPGAGTITVATLLAEIAGTNGFPTEAKMAMWAGTAPLDVSSGRQQRHRLNRRGNRQANRAIYTIALTQLRLGGEGTAYIQRRITEGKTQREALRALQRHITRRIWRTLHTPQLT